MGIDLSVKIGAITFKNPLMMASGTCGYNMEYDVFFDIKNVGAIVTKAITLEPKLGNEGERLFETECGMINRIGLENVGIKAFLTQKKPLLEKYEIPYIMNIAGSTSEEYFELSRICEENKIPSLEVNVSCPNVKSGCLEFGTNPDTLNKLVKGIRENYNGFLIIKLTPNVSDIESLALSVEKAGADCISAINTVKGLGVKLEYINGKFKKTLVQGGLSGKCIKPIALSMVKRIKDVTKLPIIGIGGISNYKDVLEFMAVGADAIQIGTENFTNPNITETILKDLENFMKKNKFETLDELKRSLRL